MTNDQTEPTINEILAVMRDEAIEALLTVARKSSHATVRDRATNLDRIHRMISDWRAKENTSLDVEIQISDLLQPLVERAERGEAVTVDDLGQAKLELLRAVRS